MNSLNRRSLQFIALVSSVTLVACQGEDPTAPSRTVAPPALAIADGAHAPGNVDFFFLPPMVLPTSSYANWTHNGFNGALSPSVEICRLVGTTAAEVATAAGSACRATPALVTIGGADVKKHFPPLADPTDVITGLPGDWAHYHAKFPFPSSCNTSFFYRVRAKVGSVELGFADVQCVRTLLDLFRVDFRKFGAAFRGTNLQIPFRVERYALCEVAGVGPCGTASVALTEASSTPLQDPVTGFVIGSVEIPAQDIPSTTSPVTVNIEPCSDLRSRTVDPLDLPTFGPCIRITTDPEIVLSNAAAVLVCTIASAAGGENAGTFSHEQEHRVTLHRRDETPTVQVHALPHVSGCPVVTAVREGSLKGVFAELSKGRWKNAGGQLLGMLSPKTLHARRIDVGGGGLTEEFSDFQYALPASGAITGGNGQVALPGSTLPDAAEVTLTDVGGEPVAGVRVRFLASGDGTPNPEATVQTGADGKASTPWALATAAGANTLVARGFGIGGTDFNGPRTGEEFEIVDPFHPIQHAFDPAVVDPSPLTTEVLLKTGSLTFTATGSSGILIYGPSLGHLGTESGLARTDNEETLAIAAGYTVTVADAATWSTLTTADFASYQAIVFGDPTCGTSTAALAAADANKAIWSAVATGPAVVIGTDPQFHSYTGSGAAVAAKQLITNGINYAASGATTGLYVSLSCYYFSAGTPTPVSFLSAVGAFSVVGQFTGILPNVATIQEPGHPVMNLLTSASLSNWGESVHEAFPTLGSFPAAFHAVATVASVESGQLPYIIVR